jgi:shikimate dehydrogenase
MSEAPGLAGVIGWPIGHSRSPALHGHWLARYGIRGHYIPMPVEPQVLAEVLRVLPKLGFRGVNVTLPHKEAVLGAADAASERALRIGAANTLVFGAEGSIVADNTDGYGFMANLWQSAPAWEAAAGPALVLGAGGAARAVVDALVEAGAPEVRVANRTLERAQEIAAQFGNRVVAIGWDDAEAAMADAATIVNTTSLGMAGQPELTLRFEAASPGTLVTDLVYEPLMTPFLLAATEAGLRIVDGLGMLLHQAAPGFERWFGRKPDVDAALREAVLAG